MHWYQGFFGSRPEACLVHLLCKKSYLRTSPIDSQYSGLWFRSVRGSFVSPAIEAHFSLTGQRVAAVLERVVQAQQVPKEICVDNGPGFIKCLRQPGARQVGIPTQGQADF